MAWGKSWGGPPLTEDEDELQLKLKYARLVAQNPHSKRDAAYKLFPGDYGRAWQAQEWLNDPLVQEEIERLSSEEGTVGELLPSKDEFVLLLWNRAKAADDKNAVGMLKLAADILRYTPDNATNVNVDARTVNVIRVPSRIQSEAERDDFKLRFKEQQMKSISDAKSSRPAPSHA